MPEMKKALALLACAACVLSLCSCEPEQPALPDLPPDSAVFLGDPAFDASDMTLGVLSPRDALDPLTGQYDLARDRVGMKPFAVMINNIEASWPQYGVGAAQCVIEMQTEGGITRFICLYSDLRDVPLIGSVRSMRGSYVEAVFALEPIYVGMGDSVIAARELIEWNTRVINCDVLPGSYWRDEVRQENYAIEHCAFTSGALLYDSLNKAKVKEQASHILPPVFDFSLDEVVPLDSAKTVDFDFSSYADGSFRYDAQTKKYLKYQYGGKPQMDATTGEQLAFDNVFVLFVPFEAENFYFLRPNYSHGSQGYYLTRGGVQQISWSKDDYDSWFEFFDEKGGSLAVNKGSSYIAIVNEDFADTFQTN